MAMVISNIPVLTGDVADEFVRKAEQAERERGSINMDTAKQEMREILSKARL